jgi:hypothetical protein
VLLAAATVLGLYGLHRLGLWMETRGWMYYKHHRGSSGSMGSAFLEMQALLEPSKRHVLEIAQKDDFEDGESGDPVKAGPSRITARS